MTDTDTRPHSRACGPRPHEHGLQCHSNCPTCEGQPMKALKDFVCGAIGTQGADPIPHVHNCSLNPAHDKPDASGGVEAHRCLCGEFWGELEVVATLTPAEKATVQEFRDKAAHCRRMAAFSMDLPADLIRRVDAILLKIAGADR